MTSTSSTPDGKQPINLDVTIDLETIALTTNAAVMQLSAVAWFRDADHHPYAVRCAAQQDSPETTGSGDADGACEFRVSPFTQAIDLRSCIDLGLDFDPNTIAWWQRRSPEARQAVLRDGSAVDLRAAMTAFMNWLRSVAEYVAEVNGSVETPVVTLWSQGSDFDIAIIRNILHRLGDDAEKDFAALVPHTRFRDARTVILELGKVLCQHSLSADPMTDQRQLYAAFPPDPFWSKALPHDALFDACRTSWQLWYIFRHVSCQPL